MNGPAEESQLIPAQKSPGGSFVDAAARVDSDSFLQLGGVDLGNNLWKWLIGLLLVFLFVEPLLAIRSTSRRSLPHELAFVFHLSAARPGADPGRRQVQFRGQLDGVGAAADAVRVSCRGGPGGRVLLLLPAHSAPFRESCCL